MRQRFWLGRRWRRRRLSPSAELSAPRSALLAAELDLCMGEQPGPAPRLKVAEGSPAGKR
jgi:hypothetical protein